MSGFTSAAIAVAGAVATTYSQIQAGNAAEAQAEASQNAAIYQAKQMEANAGQERAMSQRKAIEEVRRKTLAQSTGLARAAAGGGALDGSVVKIMGDLEEEGEYNKSVALYEGEERARDLESGGSINRYEGNEAYKAGKMQKKSSRISAASSLLKGAASASNMSTGDGGTVGQSLFSRFKD